MEELDKEVWDGVQQLVQTRAIRDKTFVKLKFKLEDATMK